MIAKPHSSSAIHHHGEEGRQLCSMLVVREANHLISDTIVYAVKGYGTIVSEGGKKRQDLEPGDFALIPAFCEHQEVCRNH
jgi:mannose-6-phosphate isomerase-like protein (cupin superfamily)